MQRSVLRIAILTLSLTVSIRAADRQTIDPEFRADIQRLMDMTGQASIGAQIASTISRNIVDGMRRSNPGVPDRAIAIANEVLSAEFSRAFSAPDGIQAQCVDLYGRFFTHEDVTALLAFYATPVGRKTLTVLPQIVQDSMAIGQQWAQANVPRIINILQERLRSEGLIK